MNHVHARRCRSLDTVRRESCRVQQVKAWAWAWAARGQKTALKSTPMNVSGYPISFNVYYSILFTVLSGVLNEYLLVSSSKSISVVALLRQGMFYVPHTPH